MRATKLVVALLLLFSNCLRLLNAKRRSGSSSSGNNKPHTKIIGGMDAREGEFPFHVLAGVCGGSLIARDVFVTAAHCAWYFDYTQAEEGHGEKVVIGATHRDDDDDDEAQVRHVLRYVQHPNFDDFYAWYDVMVVKLDSPVNLTDSSIKLVQLVKNKKLPKDKAALVAIGFGVTEDSDGPSDTLKKVTVRAVSHKTCRKQYKEVDHFIDKRSMLCAGVRGGGKDTCSQDSGGALLLDGKLVGITSFGMDCALPEFSGVYTRVPTLAPWIERTVCRMSDFPPAFCRQQTSMTSMRMVRRRRRRRRHLADNNHRLPPGRRFGPYAAVQ